MATRALAGSVMLSNGPGTVADIFSEDKLTLAFSVFWYGCPPPPARSC